MRMVVAALAASVLLGATLEATAGPLDPDDVTVARPGNQVEFSIAASPEDPLHLVAGGIDYSQGDAWPAAYVSHDGGATWAVVRLPLPPTYGAGGDPSVAFDGGAVLIAGIAFDRGSGGGANALFVSRSLDGGSTWATTTPFTHPCCFGSVFLDKPYLTRDPASGALLMPFSYVGTPQKIRFTRSDDGGATWTEPVALDDGFTFPLAAGAADGSLLVAWLRSGSVRVARSTDGGQTFATVLNAPSNLGLSLPFRTYGYPVLDVARGGPNAGRAYLLVPQLNGADADLRLYSSDDHGATWSSRGFIPDPGVPVMPWLAIQPDGTLGIQWTQALGASAAAVLTVKFAMAEPPLGLWNVTVVQDVPATTPGSSTFWGDYNGLAASVDAFHPAVVTRSASTGLDFMTQRIDA